MNTLQTVLQLKQLLLNSRPFRNSQKVFNLIALLETDLTPSPVEETVVEETVVVEDKVEEVVEEKTTTKKSTRSRKKSSN